MTRSDYEEFLSTCTSETRGQAFVDAAFEYLDKLAFAGVEVFLEDFLADDLNPFSSKSCIAMWTAPIPTVSRWGMPNLSSSNLEQFVKEGFYSPIDAELLSTNPNLNLPVIKLIFSDEVYAYPEVKGAFLEHLPREFRNEQLLEYFRNTPVAQKVTDQKALVKLAREILKLEDEIPDAYVYHMFFNFTE